MERCSVLLLVKKCRADPEALCSAFTVAGMGTLHNAVLARKSGTRRSSTLPWECRLALSVEGNLVISVVLTKAYNLSPESHF